MSRLIQSVCVALAIGAWPVVAHADGHMEQALKDFMTLLPGEYESRQQFFEETAAGVPEAERHGWVYRSFISPKAPALGEHVVVSTVRYGGAEGSFDELEYLVWTVRADGDRLRMSPRKFIDQDPLIPYSRDPLVLARLTPDMLKPADGAAGCDLLWERKADHFYGFTEDGCRAMSYIQEMELTWKWEFWLRAASVDIIYSGARDDGAVVSGRDDGEVWRLDRMP